MARNEIIASARFTVSAAVMMMFANGVAIAQSSAGAERDSGIADIVVTAQKREQNVQDVPVAVTAVSQETLQVNRVTNVMDLNGLAPGLLARPNAGSNGSPSYSIRGVFASASDPAQDRQVATYIDGVYIGGIRGAVFDLPDIERVEVLRGPQGTLFGRNATAGAVSISTRDPKGELGFRQEVSMGNLSQLRTRTTIDTPRLGIFSAFITFLHDEKRGDIRNTGAGTQYDYTSPLQNLIGKTTSPKWLGSKNAESVFAALKLAPSDDFSVVYKFDYVKNNFTPDARVPVYLGPSLLPFVALQDSTPAYGQFLYDPANGNKRPKATNNAFAVPGFNKAYGHVVTMNWRANEHLSFKNITAYRHQESLAISSVGAVDGLEVTPALSAAVYGGGFLGQMVVGYGGINLGKYSQFTNEFQVNYDSSFLTLTAGALYFHSKELASGLPGSPTNYGFLTGAPALSLPLDPTKPFPLGNVQDRNHRTRSIAAYTQAEFHVTPQLDIVAGARITQDHKRATLLQGGAYSAAAGSIQGTTVTVKTFEKTKPTFSLGANYKVNEDVLVYGKFSTAYLSGGASGPLTFEPETVKSWEGGLKSEWFDRHLRFNLAVYTATYKNSQTAQSGRAIVPANGECSLIGDATCSEFGVLVISNGSIRSRGVEAEVTVAPARGLTLGGSLSYSKTKWLDPSPILTGGRPVRPSGLPEFMAGINAQYVTRPLFSGAMMLFRIEGNYQGKYYTSPFTDIGTNLTAPQTTPAEVSFATSNARWIVNSRIALRDIRVGPLSGELGLWSRNLTNNKDATYTLFFGPANVNSSFQAARTYGVDFIVAF